MNRRIKIIFISLVIVVLLLAIVWSLWVSLVAAPGNVVESNTPGAVNNQAAAVLSAGTVAPTPIDSNLQSFSRSFAERYGSFSTHSDYENLEDIYSLMTDNLKNITMASVQKDRQASIGANNYYGITTRVLSEKITTESGDRATIILSTQRRESGIALAQPRVYYQDIELSLVKIGKDWKVDKASWL